MMIQNWCIFHAIFGMLSPNGLGWTRLMGEISTQHDFSQLWLESAWENCPIHIIQAMVIVIDIIEVTLRFYIFWWCIWIYVWDCLCILGAWPHIFPLRFFTSLARWLQSHGLRWNLWRCGLYCWGRVRLDRWGRLGRLGAGFPIQHPLGKSIQWIYDLGKLWEYYSVVNFSCRFLRKIQVEKKTPLNHQTNLANPRIPLEDRISQLVVSQNIAARNHTFLFPLIITNNLDDTLW